MPGKEIGKDYIHERITDPSNFDKRSFRTITIKEGMKAVIGCPVGKWDNNKKKCKVGTKMQKMMMKK